MTPLLSVLLAIGQEVKPVVLGQKIFVEKCLGCHGSEAEGKEMGPRLIKSKLLLKRDCYRRACLPSI